jgi:hypothetical protein
MEGFCLPVQPRPASLRRHGKANRSNTLGTAILGAGNGHDVLVLFGQSIAVIRLPEDRKAQGLDGDFRNRLAISRQANSPSTAGGDGNDAILLGVESSEEAPLRPGLLSLGALDRREGSRSLRRGRVMHAAPQCQR